ncbi:tetratricopeptide repeat protein [Alphaproteobacteria bacterium]|nr:tetratricopeptide repeat protein [Alphaproteobacteria bacterium]
MKQNENNKKKSKKLNSKNIVPSQLELKLLLDYYQKGLYDHAEKLAQSITQEFPKHQFAWKVLGVLFKISGRLSDSLIATQKAVSLSPQEPEVRLNLGIIFKELGRLNDAETSYRQSIALKPNYAEAYNNLGNTLEELGKFHDAEESYKQAILFKPDYAEAYNNLGVMYEKISKLDYAETSYKKAIALKPNYAEAYNNLGNTLQELNRSDEAQASYKQAISLKPNYTQAYNNLGNILRTSKKHKEAVYYYDLMQNDFGTAMSLECLYIIKNYTEFYKRLSSLSSLEDMNLRVAAVSALAAYQMKKKDPYPFCPNPLEFIKINNLADYDLSSNTLFEKIIKETDKYQLTWESRTTKFGFQSPSDVFENPSKNISLLESFIQQAINSYYDKFKSVNNILIKKWPSKYKLQGWYNRLVKNGHHTSHIHQTGWLSGVIYLQTINMPMSDEGAIEFSLHGYDLPIMDNKYPRKVHKPKRGDIVLFPSSLFHRTIPFTTDSERCVIAFDLKGL